MRRNIEKNINEGQKMAEKSSQLDMQMIELMAILDKEGVNEELFASTKSNELIMSMYAAYHLGLAVGYRTGRRGREL